MTDKLPEENESLENNPLSDKPTIDELFSDLKYSPVQRLSNVFSSIASHKTSLLLAASGVAILSGGGLWIAKEMGETIDVKVLRILSTNFPAESSATMQYLDLLSGVSFNELQKTSQILESTNCPVDIRFSDGSHFSLGPVVDNFLYFNIVNQENPNEVLNLNVGRAGLSEIRFQDNRIYGVENIPNSSIDNKISNLHIFEGRDLAQTTINLPGNIISYRLTDDGIILLESDLNVYRINPNGEEITITPLIDESSIPEGTVHAIQDFNISQGGNYSTVSFVRGEQQGEPGRLAIYNQNNPNENFDIVGDFKWSHFLNESTFLTIGGAQVDGNLEYGIHIYDLISRQENLFIPETEFFGSNRLKFSMIEDNVLTIITVRGLVYQYDLQNGNELSRSQIIDYGKVISVCLVDES